MKTSLTTLLLSTLLFSQASATIFTDTFTDTTKWASYAGTSPTFSVTSDVLSLAGGGNSHRYIRSIAFSEPATLSSVGDILSFAFRIRQVAGTGTNTTAHEFNIGIGNQMGAPGATAATQAVDDLGYVAAIGAGSGLSQIYRDGGTSFYLGRNTTDPTMIGATAASLGLANNSVFVDYTMTFTRTLTGMNISLFNGTTLIERSDNAVPSNDFYTFNMIAVGYYKRTSTTSLDFDSMSVSYTAIPEPGTLALVGIALATLLFFRRRR